MNNKLVVGIIIVLFLGVALAPIVIGHNIKDEDIYETMWISQKDEKPDLVIVDVESTYIKGGPWNPYFLVYILNKGTAPLPEEDIRYKDIRLAIKNKFRPFPVVYKVTTNEDYNVPPHNPGEIDDSYPAYFPYRLFGIYRCYFKVDPYNRWDELNERNNRVWAYYFFFGDLLPMRLGRLKLCIF